MGALYKCKKNEVKEAIAYYEKLFGFAASADRPVRTLNLGQRMICELTAALIHNPYILFLDEPTLGLDSINKSRMHSLLLTLVKEKNTSIVLTSHDLIDLEKLADKLLVLREGKTIFQGNMNDFTEKIGRNLQIILTGSEESWNKFLLSGILKNAKIEISDNGEVKKLIFNENEVPLDTVIKMITEADSDFVFKIDREDFETAVLKLYRSQESL